ncbi:hypothetical protein SLE2022_275080 [Rubroshorea leprosula]
MKELSSPGRYLGFPAQVSRVKARAFSDLKSKFRAPICDWREQPLSKAGREVLIKSVLQALPMYLMGMFLLSRSLCTDLERIMNRYWWGGGDSHSKIHWMEWRKLATPKKMGGLGFRALHEFNLAMLGKQGWRLLTNPESLVAQLLKAKYYPRSDFLHVELKPSCSFTWRSICSATTLLRHGCRRLIGDGRSIDIWNDPWLPGHSQFFVQSPRPADCELRYVCDLIDADSHYWKHDLIRAIFNPHEAQLILSMPLSWVRRDDGWTWQFTRHGSYSVRSGYHRAMAMGGSHAGLSPSSSSFRVVSFGILISLRRFA